MEAVILDCLRTPVGKAPQGQLAQHPARRSGGPRHPASARKTSGHRAGRNRRRDSRLRDARSRIRHEHGAHRRSARGSARFGAGRHHQSLLLLRTAGHRHGRRPHPFRRRGDHHRGRRRIDEHDSDGGQQIRAQSLDGGSSAADLHGHGPHRRGGAAEVRHHAARMPISSPIAAIRTRCTRRPKASSTTRSGAGSVRTASGRCSRKTKARAPTRRSKRWRS